MQSLIDCCAQDGGLASNLSLLVYDNSPAPQQMNPADRRIGQVEYRHDPANGGLAAAYNHALSLAQDKQIEWLLLLDQDTVVGPELLSALLQQIATPVQADVCAMVPKLVQDDAVISPQIVQRFNNRSVATNFSGVSSRRVTALNSGACLRVQAVQAIGGFPWEYRLEYLDHIMFSRLQSGGGKVLVLEVTMQHQLSLLNIEDEMSLTRYAGVLSAEWQFVRETRRGSGPLVHRLRLLKRALFHAMKLRNKGYARQTLHAALS
jgi:GT2 family glycosyltransferase